MSHVEKCKKIVKIGLDEDYGRIYPPTLICMASQATVDVNVNLYDLPHNSQCMR